MAETYDILGVEPSVERIGPTRTRDVRVVTAITKPTGIQFSFTVTKPDFGPFNTNLAAKGYADALNSLADKPGVIGVRVEQSIDAADLFVPMVVVTVESASGNSEADVRLTWAEIFVPEGWKKIADARKELGAVEAL